MTPSTAKSGWLRQATHHLGVAAVVISTWALAGCDALLDLPDSGSYRAPPDMLIIHEFVAGEWQITGNGQFGVCDSPFSEVEFTVRSATFTVEQDDAGALTVPAPPMLDSGALRFEDGRVVGTQVSFVTAEDTDRGPIRLAYDGTVDALNNVRGRFEGIGPDACLSAGTFTARVELAERPLPPDRGPPDRGPPDMSAIDSGSSDAGAADSAGLDAEQADAATPDAG